MRNTLLGCTVDVDSSVIAVFYCAHSRGADEYDVACTLASKNAYSSRFRPAAALRIDGRVFV